MNQVNSSPPKNNSFRWAWGAVRWGKEMCQDLCRERGACRKGIGVMWLFVRKGGFWGSVGSGRVYVGTFVWKEDVRTWVGKRGYSSLYGRVCGGDLCRKSVFCETRRVGMGVWKVFMSGPVHRKGVRPPWKCLWKRKPNPRSVCRKTPEKLRWLGQQPAVSVYPISHRWGSPCKKEKLA